MRFEQSIAGWLRGYMYSYRHASSMAYWAKFRANSINALYTRHQRSEHNTDLQQYIMLTWLVDPSCQFLGRDPSALPP